MTSTTVFFESDTMEWEVVDEKIQRQIVGYDDQIMMVNVKFEKGGIGAMHHHPHSQATYVAEGVFEVTLGDEKKVLKKGESFYVPKNLMHGVVCLQAGLLVDVFSPMREDFIK
ncbi:MAG: cupin domain-containing protein [Flavobacterium sp.]